MTPAQFSAAVEPDPSITLRFQPASERLTGSKQTLLAISPEGPKIDDAEVPLIRIPTPSLGAEPMMEVWEAAEPVSHPGDDEMLLSVAGDFLLGAATARPDETLSESTERIYTRILEVVRSAGKPHLVRLWNYFPRINEVDSIERYQKFCVSRFSAFHAADYDMSSDLPAASAVGSRTGVLTVVFLASSQRPRYVENRRQVSAFSYPERYGPRSPSFSRGALLADEKTLFVSGTASILGHETVHLGDLGAQVEETLRNIDAVISEAFGQGCTLQSRAFEKQLKVYVRQAADQPAIAARLEQFITADSISYLHADICRADLLVEIEAVVRRI